MFRTIMKDFHIKHNSTLVFLFACLLILSLTTASAQDQLVPDWGVAPWGPLNLSPHPLVTNPVLAASHVTDVSAKYVADPFLFFENGTWYMFFEVVKQSNSRGEIGLAPSPDGFSWTYDRIVLREDFHLSYPLVFKYGNDYYMMPETSSVQEARLYKASNFPYGWIYEATLVNGDIHDASIFRYNDTWWMFFGDYGYYGQSNDCYLYYSDNLLSGWQKHPGSPVVVNGRSKARPAGRPFVYDGDTIIRLAQKDDVTYGESVRAFQVNTLTKTSYAEHEISQSPLLTKSGTGWNASGMHTLDPWWTGSDWLCAVDGKDSNGIWSIGIYTVPMNQVTVQKSGTGQGTVSSVPMAIDCGSACNASLPRGTVVNLTATAEYGSALSNWNDCDSVDGNACVITLNSDRTATATFRAVTEVKLLSPNGGEVIPAGLPQYPITWEAPPEAVTFKISYHPLGRRIGIVYSVKNIMWDVPLLKKNKKNASVKVTAYNSANRKIGYDISDSGFTIEVVSITSPNQGNICIRGQVCPITWTKSTHIPAASTELYYSLNNGHGWKKILDAPLPGDAEFFDWIAPNVSEPKAKCKVKVVLRDSNGKIVGRHISEGNFTIDTSSGLKHIDL